MIIADIYLSFNAFFVQRAPRVSAGVESLTGAHTLLLGGESESVRQPTTLHGKITPR